MKGEKKEYQNKKRLYLLGLCGVLAISGTIYAGTRKTEPQKEPKELVDLNDEGSGLPPASDDLAQQNEVTKEPENLASDANTPKEPVLQQQTAVQPTQMPEQLTASGTENEQKPDEKSDTAAAENKAPSDKTNVAANEAENASDKPKEPETAAVNNPTAQELKFSEEEGLSWPLSGNVVKNYSADKLIYFETLGQFRTNPAIFIAGEKGSQIRAAADGIITEVKKEDKTGQTIVMDIGGGYTLTYGQLSDITVKEGDYVKAGEVFAKLAAVTKYYRMEGEHLYFQVQKDGENVNPLTLIR